MIRPRHMIRIFLLAAAGLLASCIDGREEYWLEADGGGRAEIAYTLPAAAVQLQGGESAIRTMIAAFLKEAPGIRADSQQVVTEGNQTHIRLGFAFDSALDLMDYSKSGRLPAAAAHLTGNVSAAIRGTTLDFSRTITPAKALPGFSLLPAAQLAERRLTYIMHLPAAAGYSNASRVKNSGRTLVWEFPLKAALQSPPVTRFKMPLPIPWHFVAGIALPISLAGGVVFLRLRKTRKSRNPMRRSDAAEGGTTASRA